MCQPARMKSPKSPLRLDLTEEVERHLALVTDPSHVGERTVMVVVCDQDATPLLHMVVTGVDESMTTSECSDTLSRLFERLRAVGDVDNLRVLLGLTRPGPNAIQDSDRAWFRALHRVCTHRGLTALGVYLVRRHGVRGVQLDDVA
jgi:hypothetical protein